MNTSIRALRQIGPGRLGCFLGFAAMLLGLVAAPSPATAASLVVFVDGGLLDVEGYEVEGDRVRLDLPNRGRMVVSIRRIERILEVEPSEGEAPEAPPFDLRFAEEHVVPETPYGALIFEAAQRHGLNPRLLTAVALAESSFDPEAVSIKGARGLMQLMPATAERFGLRPDQVFDPEASLDAGARYLRWLADRFEDRLEFVLAAYNAGEGAVDRYSGVPPYRETRQYLRRIFAELGLDDPLEEGERSR